MSVSMFRSLPRQDGRAGAGVSGPLLVWLRGGDHLGDRSHGPDRPGHLILDRVQPHHHLGLAHLLLLSHLLLQLGVQEHQRGLLDHGHVRHHLLVHEFVDHCGVVVAGGGLEILQGRCPPHTDRQGQVGPEK